jgi:hypothetical protein
MNFSVRLGKSVVKFKLLSLSVCSILPRFFLTFFLTSKIANYATIAYQHRPTYGLKTYGLDIYIEFKENIFCFVFKSLSFQKLLTNYDKPEL